MRCVVEIFTTLSFDLCENTEKCRKNKTNEEQSSAAVFSGVSKKFVDIKLPKRGNEQEEKKVEKVEFWQPYRRLDFGRGVENIGSL